MKGIIDLEMLQARDRIRQNRIDYFEAMAAHHMRVGQLAFEMRKLIEARRYADNTEKADEMLEHMASQIEKSFAQAFGINVIDTDDMKDRLISEIIRRASNSETAVDNFKKYLPKRTVSELETMLRHQKASDEATESKEETE